ncbi:MAG: Gfo/Idh/MocA family oxidoreductase, partial [Chloroflexota bacterium]
MTLNIGVIGAGRIGSIHAETIAKRISSANLLAVSDVFEDAAKNLGQKLGVENVYADHRRILDDPQIDAVAICSSTDTHAPFITEAAQAGKHIFCEKPIAIDLATIDG